MVQKPRWQQAIDCDDSRVKNAVGREASGPSWLTKLKPRRISQQIGYGYFAAIIIGVSGSLVGLVTADYFQGKGVVQLLEAQAQSKLLSDFERAADHARVQSLRAIVLTADPQQRQAELTQLQQDLRRIDAAKQKLQQWDDLPTGSVETSETLHVFLETYSQALNSQAQAIEAMVNADNPADLAAALTEVLDEETAALEQLHTKLVTLIHMAQEREVTATSVMETAQGFEKLLIVVSMAVSALVAGLVALRTTQAIATPLNNITHTAQMVADQADYQLRASVASDDEIGALARSLNHLIARSALHLQSLEHAAQTTTAQNQELEMALRNLKRAQMQLVQAEKMSSLGQLVAGVAHEINNPVSFIYGNLEPASEYVQDLIALIQLYQRTYPQATTEINTLAQAIDLEFLVEDSQKLIDSMKSGAERIRDIVLSLRHFSRLDQINPEQTDIHQGLDSTLTILNSQLKPSGKRAGIQVTRQYGSLPPIVCYPSQLNQVFMNILGNAIAALEQKRMSPKDTAGARDAHREEPQIAIRTDVHSPNMVRIHIQDNGIGIPEAVLAKIYDPFFTTKPIGQGTGLGLAISHKIIVEDHQGKLECHSVPNQGTEFVIDLPIHMRTEADQRVSEVDQPVLSALSQPD